MIIVIINMGLLKYFRAKSGVKVGDIMTRNFVSVKPDTSLKDCAREMIKKRVGSLVLKEDQKLYGLITEKDVIWALTKSQNLNKIKAKDISSRKVATIKPGADLYEALERMKKLKFRRLPVVVDGNVIGMLTLKDILKINPALFTNINEVEKIKEETEKLRRIKGSKWIKDGMCEECGDFNVLYKVDARLLCEQCKDAI